MSGDARDGAFHDRCCWAIGLWAGLLLVDLVVWSRSLAGAMTAPLSAPLAIGCTLVVTATSTAALILWRWDCRATTNWRDWWPELATVVLPPAWALVIGWGATPFTQGGLIACGGLLIAATGLVDWWGREEDGELASDRRGDLAQGESKIEDSTQWQKRLVVDGRELIEGEISVDFAAGQKEAVIHLSFCPPLAMAPEVHAEDSLGGEFEIRTETAHPYGARLAVRRTAQADSAESRQVSYYAMLPEAGGTAA